MRPGPLALISVLSAVIGAAAVLSIASALDWVGPSGTETVVSSSPRTITDSQQPSARTAAQPLEGTGFNPAEIYEARAEGVVTIFAYFRGGAATGGQGSGFAVSDDGYILTAAHVVTDAGAETPPEEVRAAGEVFVQFRDGDRVPARIVGFDLFDDVAVLKVDPRRHPVAPIPLGDSSQVVVGEPVAAIGSPFGAQDSLATGIVSATRTIPTLTTRYSIVDAIQVDAPINRGNSGGPLFDARGRAIGINAQIRSATGLNEGVGFAVPINAAKRSMEELIAHGKVSYAYVGVTTDDLWPALAGELGLDVRRGAVLVDVVADGPAERAGLRGAARTMTFQGREVNVGGDVVVAVDGSRIENGGDLVRIVTNALRPGREAVFTVLRNGRRLDVPLVPAERPAGPAPSG